MTGRRLCEAMVEAEERPPMTEVFEHRVSSGSKTQNLRHWRVGSRTYIDQGWLD